MKNRRQERILALIAREPVETQDQLLALLAEDGLPCTQATVSRDIKQLHLVKVPFGIGRYRYAASGQEGSFAERLQTILRESIVSVDYAQNLVVLKTMPGLASAAASAFDGMGIPMMLGTIAGDDTVLVVMRDEPSAAAFCAEFAKMSK